MIPKINVLYVHGYNGSGNGNTGCILNVLLDKEKFNLLRLDFSNRFVDVGANIQSINELMKRYHPMIIIANSLGTFETMCALGGPYKILINPVFDPINDLLQKDGFDETYESAQKMISELADNLEFDYEDKYVTYGFFGDKDDRVNCQSKFEEIFGAERMTVLKDAEHRFNRSELQLVANLVSTIYKEIIADEESLQYILEKNKKDI